MPRTATIKGDGRDRPRSHGTGHRPCLSPSLDGSFLSVDDCRVALDPGYAMGRSSITGSLTRSTPRTGRSVTAHRSSHGPAGGWPLSAPPELKPALRPDPDASLHVPAPTDADSPVSAGWVAVLAHWFPGLAPANTFLPHAAGRLNWICSLITTLLVSCSAPCLGHRRSNWRQNNKNHGSAWPVCCW